MLRYFDKKAKTQRLVSESDAEYYQDYLDNVPCLIIPYESSFSTDLNGVYGKDFQMFCEVCDIMEKDKVIIDDDVYEVKGVSKYSFLNDEHLELIIRQLC
ncbi:MAG TPA: hypothetical protein PKV21_07595 [bacterium]|nr:hypothetical protein [bacterium]